MSSLNLPHSTNHFFNHPAPIRKSHPLLSPINNMLVDLPAPINLSAWWNFGSILGLCLVIQLITGIMLAMHYIPHSDLAFHSLAHITRDVNNGWLLRAVHANSASLFFLAMYLHVGRGMYYGSYLLQGTWNIGIILFILTMGSAFLGYVLPWGQMSFWAATVITNFFSAIPYLGTPLVQWVWGGFAVSSPTLTRFFTFHFLFPFILIILTVIHLIFLHETGSNNPLGMNSNPTKIPFFPYYILKDLLGFSVALLPLSMVIFWFPYLFTEPENFIPANPLSTPLHIKPEWYFLWAYTILRSIPNKLGGVVAMFLAILILYSLPHFHLSPRQGLPFYPPTQILFWTLISTCLLLTWIGGKPVEPPYEYLGQLFTLSYFTYFLSHPIPSFLWDKLID